MNKFKLFFDLMKKQNYFKNISEYKGYENYLCSLPAMFCFDGRFIIIGGANNKYRIMNTEDMSLNIMVTHSLGQLTTFS